MFTWGRGAYGQLGRATSNSQDPEQQAGAANQEAFFPSEVETLFGATQVKHQQWENQCSKGQTLMATGCSFFLNCSTILDLYIILFYFLFFTIRVLLSPVWFIYVLDV